MEAEAKTTAVASETPKETQAQPTVDLSKIEAAIQALNDRFDKLENNKLSNDEIRKIAEKNVIESKVKEEEENIQLQNAVDNWEKRKTKIQVRNEMWDLMTSQFINEEIPRPYIRSAMLEGGWKGEMGQSLGLAIFRILAPQNGVSIDQLNNTSLLMGEKAFQARNNPRSIISMHGKS